MSSRKPGMKASAAPSPVISRKRKVEDESDEPAAELEVEVKRRKIASIKSPRSSKKTAVRSVSPALQVEPFSLREDIFFLPAPKRNLQSSDSQVSSCSLASSPTIASTASSIGSSSPILNVKTFSPDAGMMALFGDVALQIKDDDSDFKSQLEISVHQGWLMQGSI
jgi:hypothetical protein